MGGSEKDSPAFLACVSESRVQTVQYPGMRLGQIYE